MICAPELPFTACVDGGGTLVVVVSLVEVVVVGAVEVVVATTVLDVVDEPSVGDSGRLVVGDAVSPPP